MSELPLTHHHFGWTGQGYGQGWGGQGYGYGKECGASCTDTLILSNQIASGQHSLGDQIHTASINNLKETSDAARDVNDAVRDAITASNQIGNINLQASERNGGETRSSVERTAGETRAGVERGTMTTVQAIDSAANQVSRDFAGVHRDISQARMEQSQGFGDTKLEMCKQHGEIKLEMSKQHCDIQRQIDQRAAEAAKALADCCCDLKELTRSENSATRQLLQTQALDDANRRTTELQNENNLLRFAGMSGGGSGHGGGHGNSGRSYAQS